MARDDHTPRSAVREWWADVQHVVYIGICGILVVAGLLTCLFLWYVAAFGGGTCWPYGDSDPACSDTVRSLITWLPLGGLGLVVAAFAVGGVTLIWSNARKYGVPWIMLIAGVVMFIAACAVDVHVMNAVSG